jgi:Cellulase (glycosyl hydrolase family 5)
VHQSPAWSRPNTGSEVKQYPTDPNSIKPWLTFMAANFGSKLLAIEVWNEPNLVDFTQIVDSTQFAPKYVPLLKAAYAAIKAGRSTVPVILAGPSQTDDGFIRDCYVNGAKGYFDIMGVHPYQGNQTKAPESTDITGKSRMTNMPAIIGVMAQYGDSAKPIWWTEFGVSVHSNDNIPAGQVWLYGVPDEATSASYITRSFDLAWQQWPQVKLAVVYCSYKTPSDQYGHQYGFRIMEADGTVKPQLAGLAALRKKHGSAQKL